MVLLLGVIITLMVVVAFAGVWAILRIGSFLRSRRIFKGALELDFGSQLSNLDEDKVDLLLTLRRSRRGTNRTLLSLLFFLISPALSAQSAVAPQGLFQQPGILITVVLIVIPLLLMILFLVVKSAGMVGRLRENARRAYADQLADHIQNLNEDEVDARLLKRKAVLSYRLQGNELSGVEAPMDERGLIYKTGKDMALNFVARKADAAKRPPVDSQLSKMILWYIGGAVFWLIFGTTIGEYLGIKFVAPDIDHQSWLSFGRLRPVHTNAVFWGWSSLAMLGLGYYVVLTVSNVQLKRFRPGYTALILINLSLTTGTVCLMAGINNGGGEYREYIWPVMALFGLGLFIALRDYWQIVASRRTKEIYISNWYMLSAMMFALVIAFIAYWPRWQNGLGETIVQGYYMHQGVGMWFMLFTLGLVYYFLPQQLNKPIYSYSLGILAFWTQILFYTLIGTHHFVFSAIPWWLQTVAIVGSAGMLIPVAAGTINFLMTVRGSWNKVANSYTLPFFLTGIVFYFTGSYQGTAEAFRYTNQLWHFTDFTVAHSHLTMYGIIAFLLWGSLYVVLPRLTGNEPSQVAVGMHFWLALVGLMFYTLPLMIGGTLKGLTWMKDGPFIDGVVMMAPYWLWRAIGGTLMWISHLVFAYNFYTMVSRKEKTISEMAFEKLQTLVKRQPEPVES